MRVLPVVLALARQAWQSVAQILGYVALQGAVMPKYQIMGRPLAGSFFAECLLQEAGVDYEFIWVSNTHSKTDEFAKTNPMGKVPVLVCPDGHQIIETLAILNHLIEAFPQLAPKVGDVSRDVMWQQLSVMATNLYPALHRIHHTYYYAPEEMLDGVRSMAVDATGRFWDYLESQLAPYLGGDAPSAADFYLIMMTRWAPDLDAVVAERPRLRGFVAAMEAHPTVSAVKDSHTK